jgi:hypothetical protein
MRVVAMLSSDFQYLVQKFGPPAKAMDLDPGTEAYCRQHLPSTIVDFFKEFGIGVWLDGKFQFCSPLAFRQVVSNLLDGDREFDPSRAHVFGYTAFGELFIWHERMRRLQVRLPELTALADSTSPSPLPPERSIATSLIVLDDASSDLREDSDGAPLLFAKARRQLGALQLGECYGFFPALALGGKAALENIRKVHAVEHFALLSSLGPVKLLDYKSGQRLIVRMLRT